MAGTVPSAERPPAEPTASGPTVDGPAIAGLLLTIGTLGALLLWRDWGLVLALEQTAALCAF